MDTSSPSISPLPSGFTTSKKVFIDSIKKHKKTVRAVASAAVLYACLSWTVSRPARDLNSLSLKSDLHQYEAWGLYSHPHADSHVSATWNASNTHRTSSPHHHGSHGWLNALRHACSNTDTAHNQVLIMKRDAQVSTPARVSSPRATDDAVQQGYLFQCGHINDVMNRSEIWLNDAIEKNIILGAPLKSPPSFTVSGTTIVKLLVQLAAATVLALGMVYGQWIPGSNASQPPSLSLSKPVRKATQPLPHPITTSKDTPSPAKPESQNKTTSKRPTDAEIREMPESQIIQLGAQGTIPLYSLEKALQDPERAVKLRRSIVANHEATKQIDFPLESSALPYQHYDYQAVLGACCENVIGYMPLPLGVAGPINVDGRNVFLPMATTEGALVASTNRGCMAINAGGGVSTVLMDDGMTRAPLVRFRSLAQAGAAKAWLDSEAGFALVESSFNSTSRFARLQSLKTTVVGSDLYIRFKSRTGDAMGMNMISKGVERVLEVMVESGFDDMQIISLSGNYCSDKKPAAINWIEGRGKTVSAQATIPADVVRTILKTDVESLVELNTSKNLIGSAVAGALGGFNAHAANVVTAIFLATGQDPAQNVQSSNTLTVMKNVDGNLQISVYMPSIEVGTVGGGTVLGPQKAMLGMMGVQGADYENPGGNAQKLALMVASGVLAGELSLCSALAAGSLVKSHLAHNRKKN
ncbi:hypothetical protein MW887_004315 [Aspergillus wentii]|nr:hypothetical protein MW887_004315 [Aspergillus wentii]